jgi:hypothetical protein
LIGHRRFRRRDSLEAVVDIKPKMLLNFVANAVVTQLALVLGERTGQNRLVAVEGNYD